MLRLAKVVGANPKAHTVDIVMLDTADRIPNVQVMAHNASTSTGSVGLPTPTPPADAYGVQNTGGRDVFAYVDFAGRVPVVSGFKMPEIGQMTFDEPGREVHRHESDVYSTTTADGSFEKAWPNGLFLRIATDPAHEDLTGKDFDGRWRISENTGTQYHAVLSMPGGVLIHIDPAGVLTINLPGAATLQASSWTFKGPTTFTDAVTVETTLTAQTDVVGGGKSLKGHVHTEVQTGSGVSGPPQ